MAPELLVFVPELHPRLSYVIPWMGEILGFRKVHLTAREAEATAWTGVRIDYTHHPISDAFWLAQGPTRWYTQNVPPLPEVQAGKEFPLLFPLGRATGMEMDLPAAIFWLLSRAEEYGQSTRDPHGRFPSAASLAVRHGFLDRPVIDLWLSRLRRELQFRWPGLDLPVPPSRVVSSIDVDFAWRYLHKPLGRQLRTLLGDGWRNGPSAMAWGMAVLAGLRPDPYDLYEPLAARESLLFFPVGDPGPFDLQHDWREKHYRQLIRSWAERGRAGIHPSYAAASDPFRLQQETTRFAEITGTPPRLSRQHFLRMHLPDTYRMLIRAGIREDWTMGYADATGFRAGTAHPFPWYDLEQEAATSLIVHPLGVMDVTLRKYLGLSPGEARTRIAGLWEQVRKGGGDLVTLWHHPSIACWDRFWHGWEGMYRLPE